MNSFLQNHNFRNGLILVVFILSSRILVAQDRIDSAMTKLSEQYPQEKVYLAYDRTDYVIGETIWFKGFVFSGYMLSDISTNLYVEMYNANKDLLSKKVLPLLNGAAEGNIAIPDTTREGVYYIRAYTNWMLNFQEAFQYMQPILIYNPSSKLKLQKIDFPVTASAYVEGGNLLANKPTNISVRIFSDGELPQNWHGYLVDSLSPNDTIVSFHSMDPNIAQFSFIPISGKEYHLHVEDDRGLTKTISLPKVQNKGVNLSVQQRDTLLEYKVDFLNIPTGETYKLVGTIDNNIIYKAKVKNDGEVLVHSFNTIQLPRGVLRLTLFDKDYQVASERLCFLYPEPPTKIVVDSMVINHQPRANNELTIRIDSGKTVCAMVFDANATNAFNKNNLLTKVWLTSDFISKIHDEKGQILHRESSKALDALLVTNTWERFNWQEILNNKFPEIKYPKDNFKSFIGTVYYKNKPLLNEPINLILFLPDSSKQLYQTKTDPNGKILIDGLLFEGSAKVIFQQSNKKINTDQIKIEFNSTEKNVKYNSSLPSTNYIVSAKKDQVPNPVQTEIIAERVRSNASFSEKVHQLEEVSVYAKKRSLTQLLDQKLSSGRFFNPRETIYDFVNVEQFGTEGNNLLSWLVGRVPGDARGYSYYIDEFLSNKDDVMTTPINDVALIKVQGKGASHQIFIYLKRGGEMLNKGKTLRIENITGYEHQELYKTPDYTLTETSKIKNDNRNLLYWSTNISSDLSNQKYKLQYFNNDSAKKYRLVIIKVSSDDGPTYFEKILE